MQETIPPASQRNSWALITGASSGIGRALAVEFASRGHDLILVARTAARLQELAAECRERFRVQTRVIAKDLSIPAAIAEVYDRVSREDLQVEYLVNNAGFGLHGAFTQTKIEQETDLLNLQLVAMLHLTKIFLPAMIANKKGKILNVASVYAYTAVPLQSVYSATKAFILSFSEALKNELRGTGVTVTVLCPGITRTEFRQRMGVSEQKALRGMRPEKVATVAYRSMIKGKFLAIPGFANQLYIGLARATPRSFMSRFIRAINVWRGFKQPV